MPNTGISLSSLTERVRAKTEQDSLAVERLTRERFESLSKNLSASSNAALSSTEAVILHQLTSLEQSVTLRCRILSAAFGWKCLQALLIALCILTGVTLGSWGVLTLAGNKAMSLHREVAELSVRKEALEKTIASWPLTLHNVPRGRFIVPTPPHTLKSDWTFENQPAWKLE